MRCSVVVGLVVLWCGEARAEVCERVAAGTTATCSIEHGGRTREYRIHVPASVQGPAPVVINLHGRKGVASEQETRLLAESARFGFVLLSPQGVERSWNAGVGFGAAHEQGVDDVGFIRAVIGDVRRASSIAIDSRRVFATGFSNGARMVHRLACEASDVIAAVASVAGPIADRNEETGARAFECKPVRAMPVMIIHGKRDRCTPYVGGTGMDTRGNVSTPATAAEWAARGKCTTVTTHQLGSTTCEVHSGCADHAEVALCTMSHGGHVWPGGPKYPLWQVCGGTWPDDFGASEQMWRFFESHPMPSAETASKAWEPIDVAPASRLELSPVDTVDIPFDRSQLSLTVRGTGPSTFDSGDYRDGALTVSGAISLYARLRVHPASISAVRVLAQFRLEAERVQADMFGRDQQVTKGSLGITGLYLSRRMNLYALYVGASIAESRETITKPELMPTAIGIGTLRTSKRLTLIYGGGLGYALGRPWLLPAAGVMWNMGAGVTFTTILPIFAELRKKVSKRVNVGLTVSVSGDRFNFENDGAFAGAAEKLQLRMAQGRVAISAGFRWTRQWTLRGELGYYGPRTLSIVDGDTTVMKSENKGAGYLSTTVSYAFGSPI